MQLTPGWWSLWNSYCSLDRRSPLLQKYMHKIHTVSCRLNLDPVTLVSDLALWFTLTFWLQVECTGYSAGITCSMSPLLHFCWLSHMIIIQLLRNSCLTALLQLKTGSFLLLAKHRCANLHTLGIFTQSFINWVLLQTLPLEQFWRVENDYKMLTVVVLLRLCVVASCRWTTYWGRTSGGRVTLWVLDQTTHRESTTEVLPLCLWNKTLNLWAAVVAMKIGISWKIGIPIY